MGCVRNSCGGAGIWKADHASAFKQLPLDPGHVNFALVAVLDPEGNVCFFKPRTLLFGSPASVVHYNGVSRTVSSLFCRVFKIPTLGYFDDFSGVSPAGLEGIALDLFVWFNELIGIKMKLSKSLSGPEVEFLGVVISSSVHSVAVSISDERRQGLLSSVSHVLNTGSLPPSEAAVLAGKLACAQYNVFGRFGRSYMQRLYAHASGLSVFVSPELKGDLLWWSSFLPAPRPRLFLRPSSSPHFVIYTDASGEGGLGAVVLKDGLVRIYHGRARGEDLCDIYCMEILAVFRILKKIQDELVGSSVMFYIENNAATVSFAAGRSRVARPNLLVREAWLLLAAKGVSVWLERVDTKSNPADVPSRLPSGGAPPVGWSPF